VFPWIGAIVDIENHNWSICVSEIVANAAAPTCVKLQMRREQYLEHITGSTCMYVAQRETRATTNHLLRRVHGGIVHGFVIHIMYL